MSSVKRQLSVKSLGEKCQALRELEKGLPNKDVAEKYGVPRNSGGLKKQLKVNKRGVKIIGGIKCKYTKFCLQRSAHSQCVPSSRSEQYGG